MGYTNFGKIVRKEMIDHDENLLSIAQLFDVTTSFVSAVLTGGKSVPDNWVDEIAKHYGLVGSKYDELYNAYCEDKKNVRIDVENVSLARKNLAVQFQRKLPILTEDEIDTILDMLRRMSNGLWIEKTFE